MFSGIIEHTGKIISIDQGRFTVENLFKEKLQIGQSIAHDGACMTVEKFDSKSYSFFVMEESIKKTNFSSKKSGDLFNVERSLKVGDRIDGHFVSGHIDTPGVVKKVETKKDTSKIITIHFPKKFQMYIIEKGSITINGTSLTVVGIKKQRFSVSIIPLTQNVTNLGKLEKGDIVNLEFDMLGKYIINLKKNYVSI